MTRKPHPAWLVGSLILAAAVGFFAFACYSFIAAFELFECFGFVSGPTEPSHVEGGQQASVRVAALLGIVAWVAAWWITMRTRLRRWPPLLVLVFVTLDVPALVGLWYLAPVIWGPEHCVPDR